MMGRKTSFYILLSVSFVEKERVYGKGWRMLERVEYMRIYHYSFSSAPNMMGRGLLIQAYAQYIGKGGKCRAFPRTTALLDSKEISI